MHQLDIVNSTLNQRYYCKSNGKMNSNELVKALTRPLIPNTQPLIDNSQLSRLHHVESEPTFCSETFDQIKKETNQRRSIYQSEMIQFAAVMVAHPIGRWAPDCGAPAKSDGWRSQWTGRKPHSSPPPLPMNPLGVEPVQCDRTLLSDHFPIYFNLFQFCVWIESFSSFYNLNKSLELSKKKWMKSKPVSTWKHTFSNELYYEMQWIESSSRYETAKSIVD